MQFAIYCLDKPGHADTRTSNRPAHVEHLTAHNDHLLVAGPMLSVDRFVAADPYSKAGLFQSVSIRPFRKTFPQ
jgi:uncharacterized protein